MVDRKIIDLVLLNLIVSFPCGQTSFQCPGGVAFLGTEYTIESGTNNYNGLVWARPTDNTYVATCNPIPTCSSVGGYNATMNVTHSTLTIEHVRVIDAGTWKMEDANVVDPIPVDVCQLTVASLPQCSISSDKDTNSLEPGTQLTLTVDTTGYYCSVEAGFDLTTGDVTTELGRYNVSDVSDVTINTNFSVDIPRFGDVTMDFICDRSWTVTCNGVQRLLKSPPHCNITSDTDTSALDPGTIITLTVDLRNYYCSQQAGFTLTTGVITETLLENQTMDNVTDIVLPHSLNVTSDHLGDVTVTFTCDSVPRPLDCDGVDKLSGATPSTTKTSTVTVSDVTTPGLASSTTPTSPSPVEENPPTDATLGLAIGLPVLFILLIILGVIIYRYRRQIGIYLVARKKSQTELQNSNFNKVE